MRSCSVSGYQAEFVQIKIVRIMGAAAISENFEEKVFLPKKIFPPFWPFGGGEDEKVGICRGYQGLWERWYPPITPR